MSVLILNAGLQTTIQAGPRRGYRHKGVPASGAADSLSLAFANYLLGNLPDTPALELTLTGARFCLETTTPIAFFGGSADIFINSSQVASDRAYRTLAEDIIEIGPLRAGARLYVAIAGGFASEDWLGSRSTYLPASLGGFHGRALTPGDRLETNSKEDLVSDFPLREIPDVLNLHVGHSWMLRAVPGPEYHLLEPAAQEQLFANQFQISNRASRMGAALEGQALALTSGDRLPSAAVFPGTIQCPPNGMPFLLMADAQTTGGYPRIAQIIRADRHLLGQLRPGDQLQLRRTTAEEAATILTNKSRLLSDWLGDAFQLS